MLGWPAYSKTLLQSATTKSLAIDIALVLSIPLLGILDGAAGGDIRLTAFFLIPIMLITWRLGVRAGYLCTVTALATMLLVRVDEQFPSTDPLVFAVDAVGRFVSFFVIVAILGRLHKVNAQQRILATRDGLTNLYNRLGLMEILSVEIEQARRKHQAFTVMFLDCDNFKAVNDHWGHKVGDRLLRTVAQVLKGSIRRSDVASRLGGDEFVVFFSNTGQAEAQRLIAKMKAGLDAAMHEQQWPVTFSIGAAVFLDIPGDTEQVIDMADQLMYAAKKSGKDGIRIAQYGAAGASPMRHQPQAVKATNA